MARLDKQAKGYANTFRTFPCGLGALVSNLLQLEFSLRVSLHLDEPGEHLPFDTFRHITANAVLPLNHLTSWANLGDLVAAFNAGQRARGSPSIDEGIVELRHALAHGRITQKKMESAYLLVRFGKPVGDHVAVESIQTVTLEWLESQVRRTSEAGLIVWSRIEDQRLAVAQNGSTSAAE